MDWSRMSGIDKWHDDGPILHDMDWPRAQQKGEWKKVLVAEPCV